MVVKRYHIIIDVSGVTKKILNNAEGLNLFLEELPSIIGMHILKQPAIAEGLPENPGLSGFVIIDYSHISIHTFTRYAEALVDIFSCKPYKQEDAIKAVLDYFQIPRSQAYIQVVNWS